MIEFHKDQEKLLRHECINGKCFYATSDKYKLERHQENCRSTTLIKYKQEAKSQPDNSIRAQLENEKIIPDSSWHNWYFCTWDIECVMAKNVNQIDSSISTHKLVSIAIKNTFGRGADSEFYIERDSMNSLAIKDMMQKFVDHLVELREEMLNYIPHSIIEGQKQYSKEVRDEGFKLLPVAKQAESRAKLRYLNECLKLKVYSWNGERYDNNVVWAPLMDILQYQERDFSRMHIIRRGTGIMEFSYGNLQFRDFKNFAGPFSLEKFAKSCQVDNLDKTTWPYEYYDDIVAIKEATQFPAYPSFNAALTKDHEKFPGELAELIKKNYENGIWKEKGDVVNFFSFPEELSFEIDNGILTKLEPSNQTEMKTILHTSPKKYFESRIIFDENCFTMADYLREYNLNDCRLLADCIKRYSEGFYNSWNINIHHYMSLPGLSQGTFEKCSRFIILSERDLLESFKNLYF